jgi:hypothetical protein
MNTAHLNVFSQSVSGGFSPLDLNPVAYVRSWEGVNSTGSVVNSLTDLTGNGYDFTGVNSPTLVTSGINGVQSIRFDGTNYLQNLDTYTQITDLSKRFYWLVMKLEVFDSGSPYHNMLMMGVNSYTSPGSLYTHYYNDNANNNMRVNHPVSSLDINVTMLDKLVPQVYIMDKYASGLKVTIDGSDYTLTGVQNFLNANTFIGGWASRFAKMLFCEFGVMKEAPDTQGLIDLKQYFTDTYNL